MLSYLCTKGDKSRTETVIYWARGGSWWPQLLLDRLLMSESAAAMQVFIFCYENYAKRTGADAIKDRRGIPPDAVLFCHTCCLSSQQQLFRSRTFVIFGWIFLDFSARPTEPTVCAIEVFIVFVIFNLVCCFYKLSLPQWKQSLYRACRDFLSALCSQTQLPSKLDVLHRMPGGFWGAPETSCSIIVSNIVSEAWKQLPVAATPPTILQYNLFALFY